jgi:PII-like signaling protein
MTTREMICLNIRVKKNENVNGKRQEKSIIDFLMKEKVIGAIVWLGVDGFGRRGKSTVHLEGLMINQPMMIETIDDEEKIRPLLLPLKQMIGDNGFTTVHRVQVVL